MLLLFLIRAPLILSFLCFEFCSRRRNCNSKWNFSSSRWVSVFRAGLILWFLLFLLPSTHRCDVNGVYLLTHRRIFSSTCQTKLNNLSHCLNTLTCAYLFRFFFLIPRNVNSRASGTLSQNQASGIIPLKSEFETIACQICKYLCHCEWVCYN